MKKIYNLLFFAAVCIYHQPKHLYAQCGPGYTQAQLNWDYLDYYFNSNGSNPYSNFINDAKEMSQRFGIGTTWVTITTSVNTLINPGTGGTITNENGTHTGESGSYGSGYDVQYVGNGTITLTFASVVENLKFSIYDVDRSQRIQFAAADGATSRIINLSNVSGSVLSFTNNGTTTARVDATNTTVANTSTDGTVNVDIAGPVTTVTLTVSNTATCSSSCGSGGTESAYYWLSDITACVSGSFPTSWHQGFNNQPWQGNVENQPDYFLVTPDNNSCYMMDPATGRCWWQFTDASKTYMNSYAYDPDNRILYYISENVSANSGNRELKKYDFNTEAYSTVIADIGTTLGIPTYNYGVESAAAAYYNGKLYLGIEGGQSSSIIRESTVWCIDLSTNTAYQVFATDCYGGGAALHDYADLLVKDGMLINYNSARTSSPTTYPNSSFTHFDFMTGTATKYMNPDPSRRYSGQAGMSWNGNMYMLFDSVWAYSNGVISSPQDAVVVNVPGDPVPPAWAGNAGDASDPFRPKCDFGDAPATYDPEALKPAVHERSEAIRLGATWDREWIKKGVSGTDDTDDGTPYLNFLPQGSGNYLAHTYVTNNNGSPATLIAWLDYNANGVFDAGEATAAQTVPNGTNNQLYWLYWPGFTTPLLNGQTTYMRVRITSGAMTAADATGYFTNGEVEDYEIIVDNFPLTVNNLSFSVEIVRNSFTQLQWTSIEQSGFTGYEVQKSRDAANWDFLSLVPSNGQQGEHQYNSNDPDPAYGKTYYRLKLIGVSGSYQYSETKQVTRLRPEEQVSIRPNPFRHYAIISIESNERTHADIQLFSGNGKRILSYVTEVQKGHTELPLPVKEEWPAGVYMLRVVINNEIISRKMIIEK